MHRDLRARGIRVGHKRGARMMRETDPDGARKPRSGARSTRVSRPSPCLPPAFNPTSPNRAWAGVTFMETTEEGWLRFALIAVSANPQRRHSR